MPFTLAHPAAVIPLRRTRLIFSALVAGSIAPDLLYFIPGPFDHRLGHTFFGIFYFSLPAGLAVLFLFHRFLQIPLISLLPERLQSRLAVLCCKFSFWPARRLALILISIFAGILTHIAWDGFTHEHGVFVPLIPALSHPVPIPFYGDAPLFKLLQHASTLIGLAVVGWFLLRWFRQSPRAEIRLPFRFRAKTKALVAGLLVASVSVIAIWYGVHRHSSRAITLHRAQVFAFRLLLAAVLTLLAELIVFSAAWHIAASRASRRPA